MPKNILPNERQWPGEAASGKPAKSQHTSLNGAAQGPREKPPLKFSSTGRFSTWPYSTVQEAKLAPNQASKQKTPKAPHFLSIPIISICWLLGSLRMSNIHLLVGNEGKSWCWPAIEEEMQRGLPSSLLPLDTFTRAIKKATSQERERVEVSVSYGFLTPTIQVCLLREATAATQPETQQGGVKWSNCEERSIFTQSEPGLFNY